MVKADAETGVTIPYAGAGFQIYRPDGSKVEMTFTYPTPTTIDTFYTNSEGWLVTPETLEYGTGYSLVEVQAPYGYVLDSTPVYFDVTEDNSTEEGGVTVIEVTKPNMAQKGIIKVSKTGEVFSSVAESEGIYQPVYEVQGLPGAVFEITALEDVYTLDGTLRYSAGEVVDTITTGEDGTAQSQPLYLGKFQVKEIQFPHGMVDTGENVTNVELVYAGQEVEVTETSASFYNQRQKALVTLDKVLEQDETFGIGMNGEISAVTFGLYAQEDITAADGSVIPADGLLEIVSVNENGQAVCSTDLPFGSFYLKELSTDSHYLLNGETFPFTFEYGGPSVAVVEISANDGEAITNELIRGEIKGLKTDENGTGLGGAVIGLFKSDETEFAAENALATATSAEDGSFSFAGVPYGNWVLKELESPEGFILSDEVIPVTVEEDGQVVEISLANERIYGDLRLTKVDKDYPNNKLTGAEFEVYRDIREFDTLMKQADEEQVASAKAALEKYGTWQAWYESDDPENARFLGYDKVKFTVVMPDGTTYTERQDIGDGDGGVLDFLAQYPKYDNAPIPPIIIKKSNGSNIYATTDLATILVRHKFYNPNEIWYIVDNRQSLYFTQVFRCARKASLVPAETILLHLCFGTMNGSDGKPYKTRDGGVMKLSDFYDTVYNTVYERVSSSTFSEYSDKQEISQKIAIAAIKFGDLINHRAKDYIFDIEKFTASEGKTGTFLLYTIARINSILKKVDNDDANLTAHEVYSDTEKELILILALSNRVFELAYNEKAPNLVCENAYKIASAFSKFYSENHIINETKYCKKATWLYLCRATKTLLQKHLDILGIESVELM